MYEVRLCLECNEPINEEEIYCINCGRKNEHFERCPKCQGIMIEKEYVYECVKCNLIMSR